MKINCSIILCCFNSSIRLKPTLEHLAYQNLKTLTCEVILVNNNCSDDTVDNAFIIWNDCGNPFNLTIIEEKQPGLSYARKAGVLASKGEIVVFCDDDNWLDKNYLYNAYNILKSNKNIGLLGGRSIAKSDIQIPHWFTSYQLNYAVGVQALNSGRLNEKGYLWGAGLCFRNTDMRNLYQSGFKNILLDRTSNGLFLSGGDSEICKWFLLVGKDLYYDENLIFSHFISAERLQKNYFTDLKKSFINSYFIIKQYDTIVTLQNLLQKESKFILLKYILKNLIMLNLYPLKALFQRTLLPLLIVDRFSYELMLCIKRYKILN